eukprot:4714990-Prymnesium_polylepis.1
MPPQQPPTPAPPTLPPPRPPGQPPAPPKLPPGPPFLPRSQITVAVVESDSAPPQLTTYQATLYRMESTTLQFSGDPTVIRQGWALGWTQARQAHAL